MHLRNRFVKKIIESHTVAKCSLFQLFETIWKVGFFAYLRSTRTLDSKQDLFSKTNHPVFNSNKGVCSLP